MTDQPQTFLATLTHGQTYVDVKSGKTFSYDTPVEITEDVYRRLKKEATRSVRQGEEENIRRVTVKLFDFKKVKRVAAQQPVEDTFEDELEDDLDEVEVPENQDAADVAEALEDEDGEQGSTAPKPKAGTRSRSRAAKTKD